MQRFSDLMSRNVEKVFKEVSFHKESDSLTTCGLIRITLHITRVCETYRQVYVFSVR